MVDPRLRRAADVCLVVTACAIPLSTSGMELGVGALLALAVAAWWRGTPVWRRTPLDGVLAITFATWLTSTLASGHPLQAVGWVHLWVVAAYFAIFWWLADAAAIIRFVRWFVAAAGVAAVYGIGQHYTGADWYRELLGREGYVRPRIEGAHGYAVVGFFRNYLTYAHVLLLPLGFALAAREAWIRFAIVPAMAVALVFSTARGAWIAAAAMGVAILAVGRRGARHLVAVAAAVIVAWLASPGFREQTLPSLTLAEMNVGRVAIYAANLDIVRDHPLLGLGFGRYQRAARPYYDRHPRADRRSHAHNNFLQIAAEAGLVGLAAFVLVYATALREGAVAVVRAANPAVRATALGGCVAILGFLVGGLTQYSFGDSEVAIAMWATLAVLMRLRRTE